MAAAGLIFRNPELYEEVACSNCGAVYERRHMKAYNTGRKEQLICPACQRHATLDIYAARGERVARMNKNKKR